MTNKRDKFLSFTYTKRNFHFYEEKYLKDIFSHVQPNLFIFVSHLCILLKVYKNTLKDEVKELKANNETKYKYFKR